MTTGFTALAKSLILQEYIGNQNIEQLIQKDQYIKISFKEEMYANLTIDKLKELYYPNYKEIIMEFNSISKAIDYMYSLPMPYNSVIEIEEVYQ